MAETREARPAEERARAQAAGGVQGSGEQEALWGATMRLQQSDPACAPGQYVPKAHAEPQPSPSFLSPIRP